MRRFILAASVLGFIAAAGLFWSLQAGQEKPAPTASTAPPTVNLGDLTLSGPFTFQNLVIFLVHGQDTLKKQDFLTLAEAMEQKKFIIYETQNVNQLEMENLSDKSVILLSGDILKGGQQDRIAQNDQIVAPKSGKLKLACFCVEHTAPRWMKKLDKETGAFEYSPGQVASNSLRLANRAYGAQGEVWKNVSGLQAQLSKNVKVDVKTKESDSSLALSLDHKKVQEETEKFSQNLADIVKEKKDVIGYVFAINGKFVSADVYGSAQLFQKIWPRLLKATAIEAIAEYEKDGKFEGPTAATCKKFMDESERYRSPTGKDDKNSLPTAVGGVDGQTARDDASKAKIPDSGKSLLFETVDKENGLLRRNILAR